MILTEDDPSKFEGKILCIGEALIDMICTDKGKSLSAGNNFLKKPGGAPTNVAAAIAALGGKVELAAKVGNDPFGKQLIEVMQSFGVSTKWMLQDEDYFTTFAFVSLMEDGERDFVFNRGADGELSRAEIEAIDLDEFSVLFILVLQQVSFPGLCRLLTRDCCKKLCRKIYSSVLILITAIFFLKIIFKHLLISHGIF